MGFNPDQARDDQGRWEAEGEGATAIHDVVNGANEDLSNQLSEFEGKTSELESAASDLNDIESELSADEIYEDPAEQADYEKRHDEARHEAGKQAIEARQKLADLIASAQSHLGKLDDVISAHMWTPGEIERSMSTKFKS